MYRELSRERRDRGREREREIEREREKERGERERERCTGSWREEKVTCEVFPNDLKISQYQKHGGINTKNNTET